MKAADRGSKVPQPPLGSSINLIESGFSWTRILIEEKKRKMKEAKVSKEMKTSGNICAHFQTQLGCVVVDSGRKSGTSGPERDGSAYRPELQPRQPYHQHINGPGQQTISLFRPPDGRRVANEHRSVRTKGKNTKRNREMLTFFSHWMT